MTTNEKLHEFIERYYSREDGGEPIERKSFIRFKSAMSVYMDADAIEAAYTAFTGNTPRYTYINNTVPYWVLAEYRDKAHKVADALTCDPTSFTDLYNAAFDRVTYGGKSMGAPHESTDNLRKCFKAAAKAGIIGVVEVNTCGKCCIRLYYLSE